MILEWLKIPELASKHGAIVDHMNELVHWFMALLLVGWSIFLIIAFIKFRAGKNPKADYYGVQSHASSHVEVAVILVEAILLIGFAFPLWADRVDEFPTGDDTVEVRAVAQQYFWTMHYPGPDGIFGRVDPALYPKNAVGLDRDDPNGKDDFLSPGTLVIPEGKRVIIHVTSKDVIHNLALVPMRMAQDAIPGMEVPMWFTPTKTGEWEIICGQLCGPGHAIMGGYLQVKSSKEFDQFVADNTKS